MKKLLLFIVVSAIALWSAEIAAGHPGTSDYKIVSQAVANTGFDVMESAGDLENLRKLLKSPNVSLAVVQEDVLKDVVTQNPKLKNRLVVVSPLYPAAIVLIVHRKSRIKKFKDLDDRRVAVDVEVSGDYYTFLKLQEKFLINPEVFNMNKSEALEYLKQNKADACFFIGDPEELEDLGKDYKIVPLTGIGYPFRTFKRNKDDELKTGYVYKYLVSEDKKIKNSDKSDIGILLANILNEGYREVLCDFNEKTPIRSMDYIYFACSENIGKNSERKRKIVGMNSRGNKKKSIYYNELEDITVYPMALKDRSFNEFGTTYRVENIKLQNAIRLMKEKMDKKKNTRILIISEGPTGKAVENMNFIYKKLKKAGIPREKLIKKSKSVRCRGDACFYKTTIRFETL